MSRTQINSSRTKSGIAIPNPSRRIQRSDTVAKVKGYVDRRGAKWIRVTLGDRKAFAPLEMLVTESRQFWLELLRHGLAIVDDRHKNAIKSQVQVLEYEKELYVLDRLGWHGSRYVRNEKSAPTVIGGQPVVVDLKGTGRPWAVSGEREAWQDEVARLCRGQDLLIFALACALAPMLLRFVPRVSDNPGFEFVGKNSLGKSTILQLAASVFGEPQDWTGNWNTTVNALEPAMSAAADSVLLLDEVNHFLDGEKNAPEKLAAAIFKLAAGSEKARLGDDQPQANRFIFMSTANSPITSILQNAEKSRLDAVRVRLSTITVDGEYGCFSRLPAGCSSASQAHTQLLELIERHHGLAGPAFVDRLECWAQASPNLLTRRIQRRMDNFKRRAEVDPNNGEQGRVADKFAVVYAAASLAYRWRILPIQNIGDSILAVYRRTVSEGRASAPRGNAKRAIDRVREYLESRRDDVVNLDNRLVDMTTPQIDAVPGFLINKLGVQWALFRKSAFEHAFGGDAARLLTELESEGLLRRASDGRQTQMKIRLSSPKDRVYCIKLT